MVTIVIVVAEPFASLFTASLAASTPSRIAVRSRTVPAVTAARDSASDVTAVNDARFDGPVQFLGAASASGTVRDRENHRVRTTGDDRDRVLVLRILVRRTHRVGDDRTACNACMLVIRLERAIENQQIVDAIPQVRFPAALQARSTGSLHQAQ